MLPSEQRRDMDVALFQRVVEQIRPFASRINLHHRGESLLHPNFDEFLRLSVGLRRSLHVNGTLLNEPVGRLLIGDQRSGIDELSISLDSLDPATHRRMRPGADYHAVLRKIAAFLSLRKKLKTRRPRLIIQLIDDRAPNGGSGAHFHGDASVRTAAKELRQVLKMENGDRFFFKKPHDWAGTIDLPGKKTTAEKNGGCIFPWYDASVLADGRVCPCPQDVFGVLALGNLTEQTLLEIWSGPRAQALRLALAAERLGPSAAPQLCRNCALRQRRCLWGLPKDSLLGIFRSAL
jgi:radical SAM protein with 4Fe4S-binding SPASM domain